MTDFQRIMELRKMTGAAYRKVDEHITILERKGDPGMAEVLRRLKDARACLMMAVGDANMASIAEKKARLSR